MTIIMGTNEWMERHPGRAKIEEFVQIMYEQRDQAWAKQFMKYGNGDARFAVWLWLCDKRCLRRVGFGIFDIADWTWADAYQSGESPRDAVEEALASDDTISTLFDE